MDECETAPEEQIKHTNYFCMKVVAEEIDVKPVKLKEKDNRIKKKADIPE